MRTPNAVRKGILRFKNEVYIQKGDPLRKSEPCRGLNVSEIEACPTDTHRDIRKRKASSVEGRARQPTAAVGVD